MDIEVKSCMLFCGVQQKQELSKDIGWRLLQGTSFETWANKSLASAIPKDLKQHIT